MSLSKMTFSITTVSIMTRSITKSVTLGIAALDTVVQIVVMLNVTNKPDTLSVIVMNVVMLNVIKLSVIVLNVVKLSVINAQCRK